MVNYCLNDELVIFIHFAVRLSHRNPGCFSVSFELVTQERNFAESLLWWKCCSRQNATGSVIFCPKRYKSRSAIVHLKLIGKMACNSGMETLES